IQLVLSAADRAGLNEIFNNAGTTSTGGTTYNLAGAANWNGNSVADTTGNAITASSIPTPAITSASYNDSTGTLVVTGTGFVKLSGASNDIVVNKLTLTGEGGATYTL